MSDMLNTEHGSMDGFTFARKKPEGDNYFKQAPSQNYTKTMTKYRIGLEAEITWEMRKYDRHYLSSLLETASAKLGELLEALTFKLRVISSQAFV